MQSLPQKCKPRGLPGAISSSQAQGASPTDTGNVDPLQSGISAAVSNTNPQPVSNSKASPWVVPAPGSNKGKYWLEEVAHLGTVNVYAQAHQSTLTGSLRSLLSIQTSHIRSSGMSYRTLRSS